LPKLLGGFGLWLALPVAEALGALLSAWLLVRKRTVYGYWTPAKTTAQSVVQR